MEPAVAELLAKQAITELVWSYSRAVDRHDFALLRTLYTEDGTDDHGGIYSGTATGFVDWLEQAMALVDTSHAVHNHMIAVAGDTAEGEAYVTAYNRIPDSHGGWNEFIQGLRYVDRYRRTDGRWQFSARTVIVDWAQHGPALWDFEHPLLKGKKPAVGGAGDASYGLLGNGLFRRT
jgi:ketosteroid isomerase-like protein